MCDLCNHQRKTTAVHVSIPEVDIDTELQLCKECVELTKKAMETDNEQ